MISGSDLADSPTLRRLAGAGHQDLRGPRGRPRDRRRRGRHLDRGAGRQPRSGGRARKRKIPVVPRAMMLAELMRLKQGIAIAGTHGKTTTTSLVASVLAEGGLDPTFVIGGRLNSAGANAKLGSGDYIVVEADESDASFLNLMPVMAVVTNIDADHMETYGHDFAKLKKAFVDFLHRMPFYGTAILCTDDPAVREIVPDVQCPITSYGFGEDAQVRAVNVRAVGRADAFHGAAAQRRHAARPGRRAEPGRAMHNVLNALSAIAVAVELNVPDEAVLQGAGRLQGRRPALPELWRGAVPAANGGGQLHADRRLRPPPGRDGGHAGGRARRLSGPAPGAGVPAAPLHPHARLLRGFRQGASARPTRCCWPRCMRPARRRSWPPTAARWRARCAWPARSSRCSSTTSPRCRRPSWTIARDGDVVICMGAGSIGGVPAKLVEMGALAPQKSERVHARREGAVSDVDPSLRQGRRADGRPLGRARGLADVRQRRAQGAAVARASTRMPSIPAERDLSRTQAQGLRALLHRAARPLRRRRHGAGRARAAGHSLHRLRRDGLEHRHRQGHDQARLAGRGPADAALRAAAPAASYTPRAGQRRARRPGPAADRQAAARRLVHRRDQGAGLFGDGRTRCDQAAALRRRRAVRAVHQRRRSHLPGAGQRARRAWRCR